MIDMDYILVFIGGGIGCVTRYIVTTIEKNLINISFPIGTLTVNILACFLMGIVMTLVVGKFISHSEQFRLLLAVGFLGGFSTLSSLSVETLELIDKHELLYALINVLANTTFGLIAAYLGEMLIKQMLSH